ncbi:MAG: pentapeptide repeat-containing protein [Gammaproteobacteria bacterium]|nr:pentapeptide repeat-containing protein [Gammaproteobacteria bacterium]
MSSVSAKKPNLWYINKQGKVTGPFPAKLIGSYLILKRIDVDTLVSVDKNNWIPIEKLPSLIPDEVKNAHTVEGRLVLNKARLREDEREGDMRRDNENRRDKNRTSEERRDIAGRRHNNEEVSAAYLKLKADFSSQRKKVKHRRVYGFTGIAVVVALLVFGFIFTDPAQPVRQTDCAVKAAANIDWQSCNKSNIDLISSNLSASNLHSTVLNDALMVKTDLSFANLSYASLLNANLSHANLQAAKLVGANLNSANLSNTDLSGADLSYADLSNAIVSNVKVENTRFDNALWTDGRRCMRPSIDRCVFESQQ